MCSTWHRSHKVFACASTGANSVPTRQTFTSFYIDIILLITVVVVHVGSILECWRSGNGADVAIDSTGLLLDVIFINFQYLHMSCILSHCFHLCALCLCERVHAYWRDSQEPRLTNVDQTSLNFSIVTNASISWHFSHSSSSCHETPIFLLNEFGPRAASLQQHGFQVWNLRNAWRFGVNFWSSKLLGGSCLVTAFLVRLVRAPIFSQRFQRCGFWTILDITSSCYGNERRRYSQKISSQFL